MADDKNYVVGEKYWAKNALAGGWLSCFTLIRWDNDYVALMFNDRYGYVHISKENLDSHN